MPANFSLQQLTDTIYASKQSILIASGISAMVLILMGNFVCLPMIKENRGVISRIAEKKNQFTQSSSVSTQEAAISASVLKAKEKQKKIEDRLFWDSDISKLSSQLDAMASELAIDINSFKPEYPSYGNQNNRKEFSNYILTEVPISVTLKSNYTDLIQFIRRIENAGKFIGIPKMRITQEANDIFSHTTRMQLAIYLKEEKNNAATK